MANIKLVDVSQRNPVDISGFRSRSKHQIALTWDHTGQGATIPIGNMDTGEFSHGKQQTQRRNRKARQMSQGAAGQKSPDGLRVGGPT